MLYPNEVVVDANNYRHLTGDGKVATHAGRKYQLTGRRRRTPYGAAGLRKFESSFPVFSKTEIYDRALALQRAKMRLSDAIHWMSLDQNGFGYCWIFALIQAMELLRVIQGLVYEKLSATSIGGPIKHYRNEGGWAQEGYDYARDHGAALERHWSNHEIGNASFDTRAEVIADRPNFRIIDGVDVETNNLDQLWTLIVLGIPVPMGLPWWSHEIVGLDVVVDESYEGRPDRGAKGILGTRGRNQWGEDFGAKNDHGVGGFLVLNPDKSRGDFVAPIQVTSFAPPPA